MRCNPARYAQSQYTIAMKQLVVVKGGEDQK